MHGIRLHSSGITKIRNHESTECSCRAAESRSYGIANLRSVAARCFGSTESRNNGITELRTRGLMDLRTHGCAAPGKKILLSKDYFVRFLEIG